MKKSFFFQKKEAVPKKEPDKPTLLGTVPQDKLEEFWKLYTQMCGAKEDFELRKFYLWDFLFKLFAHDPTPELNSRDPNHNTRHFKLEFFGSFCVEVWQSIED